MKDLYKMLGLPSNASTAEISMKLREHPEYAKDAALLLNAQSREEYDSAYTALHEIGQLRTGLDMNSELWKSSQEDFVRTSQEGEELRSRWQLDTKDTTFLWSVTALAVVCIFLGIGFITGSIITDNPGRDIHAPGPTTTTTGAGETNPPPVWRDNAHRGIWEFNGKYYKVFDSRQISSIKNWASASVFCQNNSGILAVIESKEENKAIYNWLKYRGKKDVYFGLTDKDHEGLWTSPTKGKAKYLNWAPGEPNNELGKEHYVMFYHKSPAEKWNDGKPGKSFLFLCQWENKSYLEAFERKIGRKVELDPYESPTITGLPLSANKIINDSLGVYEGYYVAGQGRTGLELEIYKAGYRYEAKFKFYPIDIPKSRKNSGEYTMSVKYHPDKKQFGFFGKKWIKRPSNYDFAHLVGKLHDGVFEGNVHTDAGETSWKFHVKKRSSSPEEPWKLTAHQAIYACDGKYYKLFHSQDIPAVRSWEQADSFCQELGGRLAVVENGFENAFLWGWLKLQNTKYAFLGLVDKGNTGTWRTATGEKPSFVNWSKRANSNDEASNLYAVLSAKDNSGRWLQEVPGINFSFICKWNSAESFSKFAPQFGKSPDALSVTQIPGPGEVKKLSELAGKYEGKLYVSSKEMDAKFSIEKQEKKYIVLLSLYPKGKKYEEPAEVHRLRVSYDPALMDYIFSDEAKSIHLVGKFTDASFEGKSLDQRGRVRKDFVLRKSDCATQGTSKSAPKQTRSGDQEDEALSDGEQFMNAAPPIVHAFVDGDWKKVEQLLKNGASAHEQDFEGMTMLHHAAMKADDDVVLMLLKYGVDTEVRIMGVGPRAYDLAKDNPNISKNVRRLLK